MRDEPVGTQGTVVSPALDEAITWRSVTRIGLGFAAEYALLALIEDAPAALKIATVICAVAGLFVLETENWFHRQHKRLFISSIAALVAIYLCFIAYAAAHALGKQHRQAQLREIYVAGNLLKDRELNIEPGGTGGSYEAKDVTQLEADVVSWRNETAIWLAKNYGPAARVRFLEVGNISNLCWGPKFRDQFCDVPYGMTMNRLTNDLRNLSAILESAAYND